MTPRNDESVTPTLLHAELPLAVNRLLAVIDELYGHYQRIAQLADDKLAALRRADAVELNRCAAEEGRLLRKLLAAPNEEPATLARLAQCMRALGPPGRRLSEISASLPEPHASRIAAKTQGLQQLARALAEKNRLAAAVAHGLHTHVRSVFAAVAEAGQESVGYARDGRVQRGSHNALLDAVG